MVERIVSALKRSSRYRDRVEHIEILVPKEPVYGKLKKDLTNNIKDYILKRALDFTNINAMQLKPLEQEKASS